MDSLVLKQGSIYQLLLLLITCCLVTGCDDQALNNPYPQYDPKANILYSAFTERPKHLDPAISYSAPEYQFIGQIYEPPLQYSYLSRPYTLEPLTATEMPTVTYDNKTNTTTYTIIIKPGIMYQPHPAFAVSSGGVYVHHELPSREIQELKSLDDLNEVGTRELVAADYVYQIKRLVDPKVNSPVYGILKEYILGFAELRQTLQTAYAQSSGSWLDLRNYELSGVKEIDRYTYQIIINGQYPQFKYWLAMLFFAPMPWEACKFYGQKGLENKNITLDWYPVGTGAFYLTENNPERRMVLKQNPNYHDEFYPAHGSLEDEQAGLLVNAGKKLPFLDQVVFSLEKESIPYWDKFMQGYYDRSGITSDNFTSVISSVSSQGVELSEKIREKGIRLTISSEPSVFYWGVNMLDPVIGGYTTQAKKLRQAISLAFDIEEFIMIFMNGRALPALTPVPPGIFGYEQINQLQSGDKLTLAKQMLTEAGYPNGRKPNGEQLQLFYDVTGTGDPNQNAQLGWVRKQFAKIGIDLVIRESDFSRFQDKLHAGNAQLFLFGWNADYPDPEMFYFILYGPNSTVLSRGENSVNYQNPDFDKLYDKFKLLSDGPERMELIHKMNALLIADRPWIAAFYPQSYSLANSWASPGKPHGVANNLLKYSSLDPIKRFELRNAWNYPIIWPLILVILILVVIICPAIINYLQQQLLRAQRRK